MTTTLNQVFKFISIGDIEALTQKLIEIPSLNPPGEEGGVADSLYTFLKNAGVECHLQDVYHGRPDLIAHIKGSTGRPKLIFNGHMDVVPAEEGWSLDPFKPEIRNERIYGRGASDMKGGLAAMAIAIKCLMNAKVELKGDLVFHAVVDEEVTGFGTEYLVNKGLDADYAVIGEPTELAPSIAHKGLTTFEVTTHGKAAHASQPKEGINAIMLMKNIIDEISCYGTSLKERRHPLLGSPLITIGTIQGGIKSNIIPDKCVMKVDRRLVPPETPQEAVKEFKDLLNHVRKSHPQVKADCKVVNSIGPMETSESSAISKTVKSAVKEIAPEKAQFEGFIATCDGYFLRKTGIPVVICGPGSLSLAHKADEYVEIPQLIKAVKIYLLTALKLLT